MMENMGKKKQGWWQLGLACMLALGLMGLGSCKSEAGGGEGKDLPTMPSLGMDSSVEGNIRRVTEKIKFSPTNFELYHDRALLWYEAGNTERAMEDITKSIEYNTMNPEAYYLRGFFLYVQNRDEEALKDFKRSINVGTDNPEVFFHIGQIHFFRKEYDMALDAYDEAVRLDSMNPGYYFALGFMEEERGRIGRAVERYEESLQQNPTFVKALSALHDIWLNEKKNPDIAYAYNERILAIDSLHPIGRFNQGNFFLQKANTIYDESKLIDFQVLLKLAVTEYSKCLQRDPSFAEAYYNRGYCYYLMEQYNRAQSDFSAVISLDPYNEKAFFMKASIMEFQGDLQGALANYEQAEKINPKFREAAEAVKELTAKVESARKAGPAEGGG